MHWLQHDIVRQKETLTAAETNKETLDYLMLVTVTTLHPLGINCHFRHPHSSISYPIFVQFLTVIWI